MPSLLAKWQPSPAVRLAWCRVHNGQFGKPRTSDGYVAVADQADLVFLGGPGTRCTSRSAAAPRCPLGTARTRRRRGSVMTCRPTTRSRCRRRSHRRRLPATSPYPGGLPSYPFFAYFDPGARLFPASWFATALAVAEALRGDCAFERALRWYRRAFDPLKQDCTWVHCADGSDQRRGRPATHGAAGPGQPRRGSRAATAPR